jgi:hypothetical protein
MKHESLSLKSLITIDHLSKLWHLERLEALNVSWNEFLALVLNVDVLNAWVYWMEVDWVVFIAPTTIIVVGQKAAAFCRRAHPSAHQTRHCSLSGAYHVSRPLDPPAPVAHRIVRWHTGQSDATWSSLTVSNFWPFLTQWHSTVGPLWWSRLLDVDSPDSSMNYSRESLSFSWERSVRWARQPGHRTVRCTAG